MRQYNVIGDIHGRTSWKSLVIEEAVNIFVGDYFDPYDGSITLDEMTKNFLDIIEYRKNHPNTILLLGNHDLHYIYGEESTRFMRYAQGDIKKLILDNIDYFYGIAYSIGKGILVSHAGVTTTWLKNSKYAGIESDAEMIEEHVNGLFWEGYGEVNWQGAQKFMFCGGPSDFYGNDPTQGPTWVRPRTLEMCTAMPDGMQIVGHTQFNSIQKQLEIKGKPLILVDVLGQSTESLLVEHNGQETKYASNKGV